MSTRILPPAHFPSPQKKPQSCQCRVHDIQEVQKASSREETLRLDQSNNTTAGLFCEIKDIDVESLDRYNNGVLPAVHLGDLIQNRYCVVRKIGHGYISTVWLAVDNHNKEHVALKFFPAGDQNELSILQDLFDRRRETVDRITSGSHIYVMNPRDSFLEVLKQVEYAVSVMDVLVPLRDLRVKEMKLLDIRRLLFQFVQGICFLHENDVTHGDLHIGNLALEIPGFQHKLDGLHLHPPPRKVPIVPTGEITDLNFSHHPRYLVCRKSFVEYVQATFGTIETLSQARLKIIDLCFSHKEGNIATPKMFCRIRSPEVIATLASDLEDGAEALFRGKSCDIWSAACTMISLAFGDGFEPFENCAANPTGFFSEIEQKIGRPPSSWNVPSSPQISHNPESAVLQQPDQYWETLARVYRGSWDTDTVKAFLELMRGMLQIDPDRRPLIQSIVEDSWFDDVRHQNNENL